MSEWVQRTHSTTPQFWKLLTNPTKKAKFHYPYFLILHVMWQTSSLFESLLLPFIKFTIKERKEIINHAEVNPALGAISTTLIWVVISHNKVWKLLWQCLLRDTMTSHICLSIIDPFLGGRQRIQVTYYVCLNMPLFLEITFVVRTVFFNYSCYII